MQPLLYGELSPWYRLLDPVADHTDEAAAYVQALAHAQKQEQGTQYWRPLSVDLVVPREAFLLEVGLVLEGHGMACIDDAVLEVIPGP